MDTVDDDSSEFCRNHYNSCAKMISDKYRILLEQEARNLDHISGCEKRFELIVNSITKEQNDYASLELIKELGKIDRDFILSEVKKSQERILKLHDSKVLGKSRQTNSAILSEKIYAWIR